MSDETTRVRIVVDPEGARQGSREVDQALRGVASSADRTDTSVARLRRTLYSLSGVLSAGLIARTFLRNTSEAQEAIALLNNTVRATGGIAGRTTAQLDAMSNALQRTTQYGDEAIKGAMTRLLSYTSIQGQTFDRATKAVLDFATAYRVDLTQAAETVGKALEYPERATEALSRQGYRFTQAQQKQLEQMVQTGRVAEAQALVLAELEQATKGAAEAARNTFGGAWAYVRNQLGDLFEVSENGSSAAVQALNSLGDALGSLREMLNRNERTIGLITEGVVALTKALGTAGLLYVVYTLTAAAPAMWGALLGPIGLATAGIVALTGFFWGLSRAQKAAAEEAGTLANRYGEVTRSIKGMSSALVLQTIFEEEKRLRQLERDRAERPLVTMFDPINREIAAQTILVEELRDTWSSLFADEAAEAAAARRAGALEAAREAAKKAAEEYDKYIRTLAEGVKSGVAFGSAVTTLRAEQVKLRNAALDTTRGLEAQIVALRQLRLVTEALSAAQGRAIVTTGFIRDTATGGLNLRNPMLRGSGVPGVVRARNIPTLEGERAAINAARSAKVFQEAWEEAARGTQRTFADGFESIFRNGVTGFRDFARQVLRIFQGLAAQITAALVLQKLGIGELIESIQKPGGLANLSGTKGALLKYGGSAAVGWGIGSASGSPLAGAMGGAAAGFALGGPIGAGVGALAGLTSGIMGMGDAARQARAQLEAFRRDFAASMDELRARVAGDDTALQLARLERERQEMTSKGFIEGIMRNPWGFLTGGSNNAQAIIAEINALFDTLKRNIIEARALAEAQYREDLEVRLLRAKGLNEEAEALALLHKQQREMQEAVDRGYDDATRALLARVHEEERLAQAVRDTTDAIRSATSALNAPSGLRLSLHRWRATQPASDSGYPIIPPSIPRPGLPPGMVAGSTHVSVAPGAIIIQQREGEDSRELAERIIEALEAKRLRGGGDPLAGLSEQ